MTLNELKLLYFVLIQLEHDMALEDKIMECQRIIERELDLKTMDPRKRKEDDTQRI
jgi:hypothetical protein